MIVVTTTIDTSRMSRSYYRQQGLCKISTILVAAIVYIKTQREVLKMEPKIEDYTDSTCVASTGGGLSAMFP